MVKEKTKRVRLADYTPAPFEVPKISLHFDIRDASQVLVTNRAEYRRNTAPGAEDSGGDLVLDGSKDHLQLHAIRLDGETLSADRYRIDPATGALTIHGVPDAFTLEIETELNPKQNSECMGLYTSEGIFCTQCESEGFRNITYALDRPDVLSEFDVTIDADKEKLPHLLSNGKPVEETDLGNGRHRARWVDTRPKPPYLFALGAGDFDVVKGRYTYPDGETVELGYYVNKGDGEKATFALECLKNTLRHEYERWGHRYHSESGVFNTIAVDAFIFGAMENTGLNIFNSKYVLANPQTATDQDFAGVDAVINHEFCHDESGNWRIPRNWFQISFKEGLTVFRDQTYSRDTYGETAGRIADVQGLRGRVFSYDSSAMTHPMVLSSYGEVMNNYDAITYPKASEVNHMAEILMGRQAYRDAYRAFFDNPQAETATTEEYFRHLARHSGKDLDQFIDTWLNQPGVPTLEVSSHYDAEAKTYALTVKQILPKEAGAAGRRPKPFHLPLKCGLIGADGQEIPMVCPDATQPVRDDGVLEITKLQQTFTFGPLEAEPRLSLNRDATAYAKISYAKGQAPGREDFAFLAIHDSNAFKRWDALQELGVAVLSEVMAARKAGQAATIDPQLIAAFRSVLDDASIEPRLKAKMLQLPTRAYLANLQQKGSIDPIGIAEAQDAVRTAIATALDAPFLATYQAQQSSEPYRFTPPEKNRRALMNTCLDYLGFSKEQDHTALARAQFDTTDNFNDKDAALEVLVNGSDSVRREALEAMYREYRDDKLVMNKWFIVQALAEGATAADMMRLTEHPAFDPTNPNKVRAVIGSFIDNPKGFHATDGSGYAFLADWIIKLDGVNSTLSGFMASNAFNTIADYEPWRQEQMLAQVERILATRGADISASVQEVLTKVQSQARQNAVAK